jgi:hypothetical protein
MAVEVAADRPGLLVLNEMYYPGWRTAVNGTPSLIQRVDGGLRGIRGAAWPKSDRTHIRSGPLLRGRGAGSRHIGNCSHGVGVALEGAFRGNGALPAGGNRAVFRNNPNRLKA